MKRPCQRLDRQRGPAATDVAIPVETAPGGVAQVDFGYARKRYGAVQAGTHQGLGNRLIEGVPELSAGKVVRRERFRGLLNPYNREAA